jgi:4-hydroxyphenylpyruvate dioxygenase-like putative hemolysin
MATFEPEVVQVPAIQSALQLDAKSQVQQDLNFDHGAGAQHVAFLSQDIRATVRAIRANIKAVEREQESRGNL